MTDRLDKKLVDLGLVSTRSQAQLLIKEGVVYIDEEKVIKPSFKVSEQSKVELRKDTLFVGRGAHKVEGALEFFSLDPQGLIVADVGACTGGFTDYVLNRGALKVFAIDVGHGQLAKKLCEDERVINLEGTNIRDIKSLDQPVDLAVVDLSFISLKLVLENIHSIVSKSGKIVALVKPQFEVGKENIGKKGIVKSIEITKETIENLHSWCSEQGFAVNNFCLSPIKGKTGNREYFFFFDKLKGSEPMDISIIKERMEE